VVHASVTVGRREDDDNTLKFLIKNAAMLHLYHDRHLNYSVGISQQTWWHQISSTVVTEPLRRHSTCRGKFDIVMLARALTKLESDARRSCR
jgi:23S rRNA pseudoU1915 N3-methylase RlmH